MKGRDEREITSFLCDQLPSQFSDIEPSRYNTFSCKWKTELYFEPYFPIVAKIILVFNELIRLHCYGCGVVG